MTIYDTYMQCCTYILNPVTFLLDCIKDITVIPLGQNHCNSEVVTMLFLE